MLHYRPQPVPTTSCRGTKGQSFPYRVCPQQVETWQMLQDPGPRLDRLRDPELLPRFPAAWLTCHHARPRMNAGQRPFRGTVSAVSAASCPPLQAPFSGPDVIGTPLPRACRCHSPRLAMSLRSGTHPFRKCSLVPSCRGAIHPCSSYEITTLAAQSPNSNSCTPPQLRGRDPENESL